MFFWNIQALQSDEAMPDLKWSNMPDFKIPRRLTPMEAGGMTVNERLYVAGLLDAFYEAIKQKNELDLRLICKKVHLSDDNIEVLVRKYIQINNGT